MIRTLCIWIALLDAFAAGAQAPTFTVTADKQRILLGERIQLQLKATGPQVPPVFLLDSLPHFEVLERGKVDTLLAGTTYTLQQTFTLTSWDSGRWVIPPIAYGGSASKPIPVVVSFSQPFDPKQAYHDEKDILELPAEPRSTWQWYVILALLLLLIGLLLFPKRKGQPPAPKPDVHYYKKVLQQLQQLQQDDAKRAQPKQYYSELIAVFRVYLNRRKGIYSDSQTAADLMAQAHGWRLPAELQRSLQGTLEESDFVKFARYQPGATDMDRAVQTIKQAVIAIEENS